MEITLHIGKRSKKYGRQECSRRRGKYYDKRAGIYRLVRVKPRKIRGKLPLDTDDVRVKLEAMQLVVGSNQNQFISLVTYALLTHSSFYRA